MSEEIKQENTEKQYGLPESESYDIDEIKARIEKRNALKIAKKKKAKRRAITVISLVIIVVGAIIFSFSSFFVVDDIEVEGNSYYSDEEIISIAHATPGKNLIYHLGGADIVGYLEQNPYIEKASVHRRFPSTMLIKVSERKEIAAILFDDDYLVIDGDGILLRKTITEPKITEISGLVVKKIELGSVIECEDAELLKQTLEILNSLEANDLYFIKLDMEDMYIKGYVFDSLVCKGTYKQMKDAITTGKLHAVLKDLFNDGIKRGSISLGSDGSASFEPQI